MMDLANLSLIALEFDIISVEDMTCDDIKNLILKGIKIYGFSEKEFLGLTRDAKKFVYNNTKLFKDVELESKMKRIFDNKGDCYCVAFTKANRGCANCLYKKVCKKIATASGVVDDKEDKNTAKKVTKKNMDISKSTVSFISASKIWRTIRNYKGDDVFPKDSWVLLKDASNRERPIPKLAVSLLEKLEKLEENYVINKKSTFMQIATKLKEHNLFNL